jgi:hypothetical protein
VSVKIFPSFVEPDGPVLCSQEAVTGIDATDVGFLEIFLQDLLKNYINF